MSFYRNHPPFSKQRTSDDNHDLVTFRCVTTGSYDFDLTKWSWALAAINYMNWDSINNRPRYPKEQIIMLHNSRYIDIPEEYLNLDVFSIEVHVRQRGVVPAEELFDDDGHFLKSATFSQSDRGGRRQHVLGGDSRGRGGNFRGRGGGEQRAQGGGGGTFGDMGRSRGGASRGSSRGGTFGDMGRGRVQSFAKKN